MSRAVIYVMAGGTGGHVLPALAVAGMLAERGYTIRWMGTERGIESRLVPEAGYPIDYLAIGGLRGKGLSTRLAAPFRLLHAVWQAGRLLRRHRPALVIGMGGFAAGPGGLAAWLLRRPLVIHEQNAVAGLTNRVLSRLARVTLAAYPRAFGKALPSGQIVGNPVRAEIAALAAPGSRFKDHDGPVRVLVLGGSLGAQALNESVPQALARISQQADLVVRHQAGPRHLETARRHYEMADWGVGSRHEVAGYIDDMAEAFGWADFVIARAGAMTVAEIAAAGIGALFIPFPHAVDDHQRFNAAWLVDQGAARLLNQREADVDTLARLLGPLLADRAALLDMATRAREVAVPDSTARIAAICEDVVAGKTPDNQSGEGR
ncbi:undecaprenyldiphospho-muramoylpentapeptide beta-N-acetylglucosaminyltransferase [Guyparkeria hydrothermalis]|uniref:undecaprenyldiphospho-muramoylpentapeptide beta-N-acetylglucosaminyltransferase n=1 Tax=Guyparkeria TaxID=2035712 RepID=UPI0010AB599C|nr:MULTISPECIES: undecaprenyldiphospho-muramoylpentapeptide beta-N-acetylglucosaminyltransferase [Guyparkeria]MCL7750463.1 undecaprenyldiphospho-muramoylpentapeptide beta-N-acetylglucosaminyltransferase [Guyparkeria hydrothermalis]TKA90575.1 undecaprenyldiphospho-muramoylpentapeptide beta-N-acetylglucosaminyltransferase [Guyparkeria sp. SB14A]